MHGISGKTGAFGAEIGGIRAVSPFLAFREEWYRIAAKIGFRIVNA